MEEISQKAYWTEVESLANDCAKEAKEGDRELSEVVWETCDGHQWVIYTFYNYQVIQHTGQDIDDRFADMGGMGDRFSEVLTKAAYLALEGDVMEKAQEIFDGLEDAEEN